MPETKVTLYDTTAELTALIGLMEQHDEEPTEEMQGLIQAALEQHLRKVDSFAQFLVHLENQADFASDEIKRLTARKRRLELHHERLSNYALRIMDERGWLELNGETADIRIKRNPPAVNILDADAIPAEFKTIRQEVTLDKNGIKARIKAGKEVPGAELTQTRKVVIA
jgi:hypothetical protein